MEQKLRLPHFTISFFAIVLGLSGLALTVVKISELYPVLHQTGIWATGFSLAVFAVVFFFYLLRIFKYPQEVKKEFFHPVKMNFFPLLAKIFLVHSVIFLSIDKQTSFVFWILGVIVQTVFIFAILSVWIRHTRFEIHHMNPAWFMPVVGAIMIPITGVEHAPKEISWFFFAIGVVLWLALFTIVFYRMIFHSPIADKLLPTLFILFAPPAIGFISYYKLTGGLDAFGSILYYFALFLMILVFLQVKLFSKISFFLSWWAYSFPLAAISVATVLMYRLTNLPFFQILFFVLAGLLVLIVLFLMIKTTREVIKKSLCIEEKEEKA
ncbi:MAG TPA: C4-dicarboxylate ABC transporter [Spirochaetia bacterium]|nr:MAG: C4-dicarboxylate ABC transporter [Spirochaetes bacterium GWB1_36_13]HCL56627.1 C4-dicarboxylate ABC transporter [Spirochaetia bacterium]